jgi:hypothetical protein
MSDQPKQASWCCILAALFLLWAIALLCIIQAPLGVYQYDVEGEREMVDDHPIVQLASQPNQ